MPSNYETADQLSANKPSLQTSLSQQRDQGNGTLPHGPAGTPENDQPWMALLDTYLNLQQCVDQQVGLILDTLAANPEVAANTIVIFTSDHGEYAGAHGLRTKGSAGYDEGIKVPLYVQDPTERWHQSPEIERAQLFSAVDFAPLLLTLASGNGRWRQNSNYRHLSSRADISATLRDPNALGRDYILHTFDESGSHVQLDGQIIPSHVTVLRQGNAKLVDYSFWKQGTVELNQTNNQSEIYDYTTRGGKREMENVALTNASLYNRLYALLNSVRPTELQQPLPKTMYHTQQRAIQSYLRAQE